MTIDLIAEPLITHGPNLSAHFSGPSICAELTDADRIALERAVHEIVEGPDLARREQIFEMLADGRSWNEVAMFCSYCRQVDSLDLKPWQTVPAWLDESELDRIPAVKLIDDTHGHIAAAKLLRKMLSHGVSRFDSDPLQSIALARALTRAGPNEGDQLIRSPARFHRA